MDVIVIGGGASGLVSAIKAQEAGARVTILEKNNKCGKKLLATGNGRCNYWNENQTIEKYHSNDLNIFKEIYEAKKNQVEDFFENLGIVPKVINGYYYPYTMQASSILNALLVKAKNLGINIIVNTKVLEIKKDTVFQVITEDKVYVCDKVILAVGSKAAVSDEDIYKIVTDLGHSLTLITPSLVQVIGRDKYYKEWAGVRAEAKLTLLEDGVEVKKEMGEVQFTDYGISGICVFNLSGIIARGLSLKKEEVVILNLVPWFLGSKEEFEGWLDKKIKEMKDYKIKDVLEGFLNYKLGKVILNLAKIEEDTLANKVDIKKLADLLENFKFKAVDTKGFLKAQVCAGGVPLSEINPKTMESKIVKGLYLTGEVLDVDGDCGGYNLGFAWMSAMIAGENIND